MEGVLTLLLYTLRVVLLSRSLCVSSLVAGVSGEVLGEVAQGPP